VNVTVTGAAGFLGRNVVAAVTAAGHRVTALDRAGEQAVDVTDPVALVDAFARAAPDVVVHLAATTTVGDSGLAGLVRVNVAGTQAVLGAARAAGARRCLVASSTAVFGDSVYAGRPLVEETPVAPVTAYGWSKVAAESLVRLANTGRNEPWAVVVRLPALFGPWEEPTPHRTLMSPPRQLVAAQERGESVVLAEGGARDWTFAPDVADAVLALATAPRLRHEIYHAGCGVTWRVDVLADLLQEHGSALEATAGTTPTLDYGDDLGRSRDALDAARLTDELGVTFTTPRLACRRYLDWLDAHRNTTGPIGLGPRLQGSTAHE